jgi:uncharacterized protein
MLNDPLPKLVDVRKLIQKSAEISAQEPVANMQRLAGLLADDKAVADIQLSFYIDESRFRKIEGRVTADVAVICQRCMEPVKVSIEANVNLAVVWSEEDAKQLPKDMDPFIAGEEPVELLNLVEDELMLNLPIVSYHPEQECTGNSRYSSVDEAAEAQQRDQQHEDNPFKILEQLKSGKPSD